MRNYATFKLIAKSLCLLYLITYHGLGYGCGLDFVNDESAVPQIHLNGGLIFRRKILGNINSVPVFVEFKSITENKSGTILDVPILRAHLRQHDDLKWDCLMPDKRHLVFKKDNTGIYCAAEWRARRAKDLIICESTCGDIVQFNATTGKISSIRRNGATATVKFKENGDATLIINSETAEITTARNEISRISSSSHNLTNQNRKITLVAQDDYLQWDSSHGTAQGREGTFTYDIKTGKAQSYCGMPVCFFTIDGLRCVGVKGENGKVACMEPSHGLLVSGRIDGELIVSKLFSFPDVIIKDKNLMQWTDVISPSGSRKRILENFIDEDYLIYRTKDTSDGRNIEYRYTNNSITAIELNSGNLIWRRTYNNAGKCTACEINGMQLTVIDEHTHTIAIKTTSNQNHSIPRSIRVDPFAFDQIFYHNNPRTTTSYDKNETNKNK